MGSLLAAIALALLVIYAGIKLLIQVNKEALGNLYRLAAWGIIIAGKLLLLLIVVGGIIMICSHGMKLHKGKMKRGYENYEGMNHHMHGYMMQQGCAPGGMCSGMSNMGSCKMGGGCGMMGNCKMEGMCGMMGNCKMNTGTEEKDCCSNMMMHGGADSLKRKR